MPEKVDRMPGSWVASLDWEELSDGSAYCISAAEMGGNGAKLETVRVYAHSYANDNGFKFKTKATEGDLYLQRKG